MPRKRTVKLQTRKNEKSKRRNAIDRYNKKTFIRNHFILEMYVYRQNY